MARTVGVTFAVGASVNRTVAGAFQTVQSRVRGLRSEVRGLESASRAATQLGNTRTEWQTVRVAYRNDPTEANSAALERTRTAYRSAVAAGRTYGITVRNLAETQTRFSTRLEGTRTALARQETLQANQARRRELNNEIFSTVGMAMTVAAPIKVALAYEVDFADLKKVADFASAEQEKQVQQDIFEASRRTGINASGMTKIAAAAGESGVVNDENGNLDAEKLKQFLNDAAEMSVAYGISAEEAGERLAIFQSRLSEDGMSLTAAQTKELGDSMNYVASKMNATAADTSSVVARMGAVGSMAGLSAKSVAGLAAALVSTSENKESAGTAMKSFLLTLAQGDAMSKQQKEAFARIGIHNVKGIAEGIKKGGPEAEQTILSVLAAMKDLPEAEQAGIAKEIFQQESMASLAPLINDLSKLRKAFALANSTEAAGSQLREFKTRSETTSGALERLSATTGILGITLGSVVLPALATAANMCVAVLKPVTALAAEFPLFTQMVMLGGIALVGFKVAALAGGYAVTVLSDGWQIAKGVLNFLRPSILMTNAALLRQRVLALGVAAGAKIAAAGQWILNAALTANPIGLVVVGLTALGAGMVYLYNTCEPVRAVFDSVFIYIGEKFDWVCEKFKTVKGWLGVADSEADKTVATRTVEQELAADPNMAMYNMGRTEPTTVADIPKAESAVKTSSWNPFSWGGDDDDEVPASPSTVAPTTAAQTRVAAGASIPAVESARTVAAEASKSGMMPTAAPTTGIQTRVAAETTRPVAEPAQTAKAQARRSGSTPAGAPAGMPDMPQPPNMPAMSGGTPVNVSMNFTLNGVTDGEFARRVIASINAKKTDVERLISGIVAEQRRLAYGA